MHRFLTGLLAASLTWIASTSAADNASPTDAGDVIWDEPSRDSSGSMPLGNGDLALNAWVERDGDLRIYLSKSDAWDGFGRLLKIGGLRVRLEPNPFRAGQPFRQHLHLADGTLRIDAGQGADRVTLSLWVDANQPVLRIELDSAQPVNIEATLEPWRRERRTLSADEASGADTFAKGQPVTQQPDSVLADHECCVVWHHRNEDSIFKSTLIHQDLGTLAGTLPDPLLHRTFGGALSSPDLARANDTTLKSARLLNHALVSVHAITAITATPGEWLSRLEEQKIRVERTSLDAARAAHREWWRKFWGRSWVRISSNSQANGGSASSPALQTINRGYLLQRFLNACAGRGAFPIKFNGSLFTVDVPGKFDPDYRQWGGCYWFQNTRLPYWPMLASGDFDLMEPFFRMYRDALPLARERTRIYYGHGGAFFPETMHFWGTYHNGDMGYGWDRAGEPLGRTVNRYIRFHWSGALELVAMMLDHHAFTGDARMLRESVLPMAAEVLEFYTRHYPRQPNGRILFAPAQALETWWECENPMPEVAGLHFVLERLLAMPGDIIGAERRANWQRLEAELPPVPIREINGTRTLVPAESWRKKENSENPELYGIFPFRVFGVGKPDLEVARAAFARREFKGNLGWQQDDTQAAFLGLAAESSRMLANRLATKHEGSRFPAFWGPNFDWIPDQDHGGNALMTLQTMLLQCEGSRIVLFPAWPRDWDVEFKLHAPHQSTVECAWRSGALQRLVVTPPSRERDVIRMEPQ